MAITCPKCGHVQEDSSTCIKCGIIFAKFKQIQSDKAYEQQRAENDKAHEEQRAAPVHAPLHHRTAVKKSGFPTVPVISIAVILCIGIFVYFNFIEPYWDASNFKDSLKKFGSINFHIPLKNPLVEKGELPYRTGKLFIIMAEYRYEVSPKRYNTFEPEIHSVWYKLSRSLRAKSPEDVGTLIRVRRRLRKTQRFRKLGGLEQKVVSRHIHYLDVFDWQNEQYIGTWTIDPGSRLSDEVTEDELDKTIDLTSDEALLEVIESMPEI